MKVALSVVIMLEQPISSSVGVDPHLETSASDCMTLIILRTVMRLHMVEVIFERKLAHGIA